jgi:hypothetical protein
MLAAGVLRSTHFIKGPAGGVLMFDAGEQKEVEALVGQLPLVGAGLLTVEIIPLALFTAFAALFASAPA